MANWAELLTEQRNPASAGIDEVSTLEMLTIINREDARVSLAVAEELPSIARAVDVVVQALRTNGRLLYMGAGSSGRLGILDAAECPPTYNANPEMIQGLIAGGRTAVFKSVEGAEDDPQGGVRDLRGCALTERDVVMGIAASGVTPYVVGGLEYARSLQCPTIFFTCSPSAAGAVEVDIKIAPQVGPEVITGSTRMKAGTATKLVLNMISTAVMVQLGKTYGNLMVDLQPKNAKLRDRSVRIFMALTQLSLEQALHCLKEAGNDLKTALVMELRQVDMDTASQLLDQHCGGVKKAVRNTGMDG